jgi:hypothetical protein
MLLSRDILELLDIFSKTMASTLPIYQKSSLTWWLSSKDMDNKGCDYFQGVSQAYERGAAGCEKEAGL